MNVLQTSCSKGLLQGEAFRIMADDVLKVGHVHVHVHVHVHAHVCVHVHVHVHHGR